jgi:hypothetical protein
MADTSLNLPISLLQRIEKEKTADPYLTKTATMVIQEALAFYFNYKDKPIGTPVEKVPVTPVEEPVKAVNEISPGLQIPKEKIVNDPEITSSFSIKPGPGLATRLQAIGVSLRAVTQARRGKIKGMPYDTSLEKYFDLVGNG